MTSVSAAVPVAGPVFLRQLARLAGSGAGHADSPPLAGTLAQWIDWQRAVTLAAALDGRMPDATDAAAPDPELAAACAQRHAQLGEAIAADPALTVGDAAPAAESPDFAPFRARHLAHQRAMLAATGRLRGRLRDALAAIPRFARLAEVDAAMEQALAPREHVLLGGLPDLLAAHFLRLREQAASAPLPQGDWLDRFRLDMRALLLAELDLRFSPIEALLAALRTAEPTP